ncbi:ubiquitin carboxyl-terminal hydrolase 1 [Cylas formicarius]|uniref:ubiquitin carboxyl-terminal hydrolase 1 n=1 Tax=Cylas formicarius TaxID=197179 RepID=UPI002958C927|nr:ubiquitin carboxyl-terminal hydrolase 1 [Cylas formicarius]XP_060526597.1 ubiquitin carboxyl-terminal hydrolase 1 [Cylas formicarius]
MNGQPVATQSLYSYTFKSPRTLVEQQFDYVFKNIPYDQVETTGQKIENTKRLENLKIDSLLPFTNILTTTPLKEQKPSADSVFKTYSRKRLFEVDSTREHNSENFENRLKRKALGTLRRPNKSKLKKVRLNSRVVLAEIPFGGASNLNFDPNKNFPGSSMMTDYLDEDAQRVINGDNLLDCPIATLLNMGNTCFLNSVLYTLRFVPTFSHNLHHLFMDLNLVGTKLKENKTKTSSLGRNGSTINGASWRSASSKDLLSIGNDTIPKSANQIVTEKLHALFATLNNLDAKDSSDPYQPEALLQAIREANPLFEGNHQQDAHEFFVELLSSLRLTCDELNEKIEQNPDLIRGPEAESVNVNNSSKPWKVSRSWQKSLRKKEKNNVKKIIKEQIHEQAMADSEDNSSVDGNGEANRKKMGYNFIVEDFEGVSLHRTKCLECEEVSERKEPFLEIQVPVSFRGEDLPIESIFGSICVTSEKLCDQNKYYCGKCNRYNEAVREVLYEKLPNIMVLHLKRFTTTQSGIQKVNVFVPTPLELRCFCQGCSSLDLSKMTPHRYKLCCVIMHLGASMASGHYIAYTRASFQTLDYLDCCRDNPKNFLTSSSRDLSLSFLKLFRPKVLGKTLPENQNGLGAKKSDVQVCPSINCCGVRCKLSLGSPSHDDDWLEFDDEKVKVLSSGQFTEILNRRSDSTNTPYLLFYSKV